MFIYGRKTFIGATRCSIDTCKWLENLLQSLGKRFIRLKHIKIFETVQKSNNKIVSKEAPEFDYSFAQLYIQNPYCHAPGFFFCSFCGC